MVIYKTTNLINGKMYIGKDKNNNSNYYGSGKALKKAIILHGKDNFKKEVIEECDSYDKMNEREIYWIEHFNAVKSREYYNLKEGGDGGDCPQTHTKEFKEKMSKLEMGEKNPMYNKKHKKESKQLMKERAKGRYTLKWFIKRYGKEGKQKWEERNKQLSEGRMGDKNPFFGKTFKYEEHPRYKKVDKNKLLKLIESGLTLGQIGKYFDCSGVCIGEKIKHYWDSTIIKMRQL